MGVQISDLADGVMTVTITGTLRKADLQRAQASAVERIRDGEKVRFLVIATKFLGWDRTDDWGDVSFPASHDRQIERIAIVGDRQWEDLVLAFTGRGYRPAKIEYFGTSELARARAWVSDRPAAPPRP